MSGKVETSEKTEHGRDKFLRVRPALNALASCASRLGPSKRMKLLESLRFVRGLKGVGARYVVLKSLARRCGDNVAIYPGVYLLNAQNISLGNNVSIHPMCYLDASHGEGSIEIGSNVSLAHGVTIMATTHTYDLDVTPIKYQRIVEKKTVIGDNVWIGAKATILAGITVEEGCVIGANAVVTRSTEKDGVYVGSPARRIKNRINQSNVCAQ